MRAANLWHAAFVVAALFWLGLGGMWLATRLVEPAAMPPPEPADEVVFRAKHFQTKGPCIRIGDSWDMPVVEAFEVTEVVRGHLPVKQVEVRPLSGSAHLRGLGDGEACTLHLFPSQATKEQLRGEGKDSPTTLWVDGSELRVERQAK